MIYLTGVSNEWTRAARRPDLGLLGTPAGATWRQKGHYPTWAADNGCFVEQKKPGSFDPERWLAWLTLAGPEDCLWAVLPDVLGDHRATWERSQLYVDAVKELGFPLALVLQDGMAYGHIWREMLNVADAVFVGGTTEFKLGPAARCHVRMAKNRGLWVHMGRVNSLKRLRYATEIGCDSADGTYLNYGSLAKREEHTYMLFSWLDTVNGVGQ